MGFIGRKGAAGGLLAISLYSRIEFSEVTIIGKGGGGEVIWFS